MIHFVDPDRPGYNNISIAVRAVCRTLVTPREAKAHRDAVTCPQCLTWLRVNDALGAATEVCPNCFGSGEVVRHDGSDAIVYAPCLECGATGSVAV